METVRILGARAGRALARVVEEIGERHGQAGKIVLLVPEQYTLQAERELVRRLRLPGLLDLDVLSPSRLLRRIRERGGQSTLAPLDDRGRQMALSEALNQTREELQYYGRVALSPGLPERLSALLADMQRAGLTPDALRSHAEEQASGAAQAKERDLATIWAAYDALLNGRFADENAQQQDARERLPASEVVKDAAVWVYGFDVLPQPLCELLCVMAGEAERLTVMLTMDRAEADDGRIFLTQRLSADRLAQALARANVPWRVDFLPEGEQHRAPELCFLEKHLFTRKSAAYAGESGAVTLHAAATPFAEASYTAETLWRWHEGGIPWSRMAVAQAAGEDASGALGSALKAAGVPHYMARKDPALRHGLCRLLLGALRAATGGYRQQDVLDAARSGFSPLTEEEAMALENYALENGTDRRKWLNPFTRGAAAEQMEPLRQRLMAPLIQLQSELREAKDASASMEAVYRLLERTGAYRRLLDREARLLAKGMQAEAAQNRQVWQLTLDLLDQLHALLGGRRAAMRDVARYVASGLASASISALPPAPDSVMVGEAGHLMTGVLDALIVTGLQDGVMAAAMDSLLTEAERASLSQQSDRDIGLTAQQQTALRQSDFYRTLALPEKLLTLTWAEGTQDGASLRPAQLIFDVRTLLPRVPIDGGVTEEGVQSRPLAPLPALDGLALRLRAMAEGDGSALDADWQEALRYLWQSDRYHNHVRQIIAGLDAPVPDGRLDAGQAARLFGQETASISRLEEFAACPYQHFVDYGLRPVIRRDYAFEADERGTFFHEALRGYATLASAMPQWPAVDEAAADGMMDQVLQPLTALWQDGPLTEDAMGKALGRSYIRTIKRAAWLFTRHAQNSRFTTWGAEVAFGREGGLPPVVLALPDGRQIALRGIIDRIDRFEGDKGLYLRVVDYKSSQKSLDPVRMWYGLQLQLLLYLKAVTDGVPGAQPAGAFYFTIRDPLIDSAEDAKEAAEAAIARELRLKGVVLAEAEVVDAMDADLPAFSLEKVFKQDGTVAASASAVDLGEMRALLAHAENTAAQLAQGIREGHIEASPAVIRDWSPCQYCQYAAVCRLDPTLPGQEKRELSAMDRQEFRERLANQPSSEA